MVVSDSNHDYEHTYPEIEFFARLVGVGQYLVVEDTNIYGWAGFLNINDPNLEGPRPALSRRVQAVRSTRSRVFDTSSHHTRDLCNALPHRSSRLPHRSAQSNHFSTVCCTLQTEIADHVSRARVRVMGSCAVADS